MIKIKVDNNGHLKLNRAGNLEYVYCPYVAAEIRCGDWCAKWQETNMDSGRGVLIDCCGTEHVCNGDEFEDDRL